MSPPTLEHLPQAVGPTRQLLFASDFHLGAPDAETSRARERRLVRWLSDWEPHLGALFLLGDVFDFWHEYRHVVPKGFVRLLGRLAEMADAGYPIHVFSGNHDLWMHGYLRDELGVYVHHGPRQFSRAGKSFYLAHGDGLGPGDRGYKLMKRLFTSALCQRAFRALHPDWGVGMAHYFSRRSRQQRRRRQQAGKESAFLGAEREWLILHSQAVLQHQHFDYFVYGHRHCPMEWPLESPYAAGGSSYLNLGEWLHKRSFAAFDGEALKLHFYQPDLTEMAR